MGMWIETRFWACCQVVDLGVPRERMIVSDHLRIQPGVLQDGFLEDLSFWSFYFSNRLDKARNITFWLVVSTYPSEKWWTLSVGMMKFPISHMLHGAGIWIQPFTPCLWPSCVRTVNIPAPWFACGYINIWTNIYIYMTIYGKIH